ncbi:MAG TPA: GNAT family N-acetyltransferase [Polyangiaceae bacterium]|nr:GNAT family N-acetyltransferase [Polyangiaceae bacterium]
MTTSANVKLRAATAADAELLGNLLELYIHDLSAWFPQVQLGPDGRFGYPALPQYVAGPSDRWAWLIEHQGQVAGFVLARRGSPAADDPAVLDVAEFFVLRGFRGLGVGFAAAHVLWKLLPGTWTVRVSARNTAALPFWQATIAGYLARPLSPVERSIAGKPWLVFQFGS